MKIAILTSGILPVPAVQGGAVENLIDFYLEYNDKHHLHDITVYSVWHPDVDKHPALQSEVNSYIYMKVNSPFAKIKKFLYSYKHKNKEYYHYTIEYYLEEAIKKIQKEKYDLIIVENRPGFSLKLKERIDISYILHLHNDFLNPETKHASDILNGFKRVISVSDYITNRVKMINASKKKCITVYNAIDYQHFNATTSLKRKEVGLSESDFVVVYNGRLREEKGILELIQAIKLLRIDRIKLLIIGANNYGDSQKRSPYMERLEKESEPMKDQVVFTGYVDYTLVPSYLKLADVAAVPSMWEEPFGLTVIEAMAAGLPLITTRSGGIPEICEGVATIVERKNIAENLANAIQDLYLHPEKRAAMAKASLERSKLFDKETYAKNFFTALEGI